MLVVDEDVLGVEQLATHRLPLEDAPRACSDLQAERDGTSMVLLAP